MPRQAPIGLAGAVLFYALFLVAPQVLNDGDTWWHVATGDWILHHRAVPTVDPFSWTFAGRPWVAHEWLADLLMGAASRLAGWDGVLILCGAAAGLTIWLLARDLGRWLDPVPACIALVVAAGCLGPGLLARPHVLALPVMELWTAGLLLARQAGTVPWRRLPLMVLWVNLHGGFLFGLALVGPFALEAVLAAGVAWRPTAMRWALFLVAATLLAMLNPHGWHALLFPISLVNMPALQHIGEWRPPDFQSPQPLEVALMVALYAGFSRGVRIPPLRLLLLLGLLHLALQHQRHAQLVAIVGTLVFAAALGRQSVAAASRPWRAALAGAAVLAALLTGWRLAHPVVRADDPVSPITALAHVPPSVAARKVLNEYGFGGYLIFAGVRPFIDSRADMYGDAFLEQYAAVMRPDPALLADILDKDDIGWTILAAGSPAVEAMDALGWQRLFADGTAVVHVRPP